MNETTARPAGPGPDDGWERAEKVLCVRLDTLGDVLMTTPAIRAVKLSRPGRHVTLLTAGRGTSVARLVPEIDQAIGLVAQLPGDQVIGAPVLHDGRIEGRLVHLVFGIDAPVVGQGGIDGLDRVEIVLELAREVHLAREVGAVADPYGEGFRADGLADLDTFEIVLDGLLAGGLVGGR